ncbi:MAG: putative two-component hybrid sensor and regulator [Sylvanvirus sp.]|uniref:histidine kinase n=1 Tax=Sylvanvirus sp. TaxID=2487774 RepID=A0A3G5AHF6_9VIRU|nr:MAG: putative two-component hybrid sensor and regulator [Sylvanvirus sp.]
MSCSHCCIPASPSPLSHQYPHRDSESSPSPSKKPFIWILCDIIILAFAFVALIVTYFSWEHINTYIDWIGHTDDTTQQIAVLKYDLMSSETSAFEYLSTSGSSNGSSYYPRSNVSMNTAITQTGPLLLNLTLDNNIQEQDMQQVFSLILTRNDQINDMVDKCHSANTTCSNQAIQLVDSGKLVYSQIFSLLLDTYNQELNDLSEINGAARLSSHRTLLAVALGLGTYALVLILNIMAGYKWYSQITRDYQELQSMLTRTERAMAGQSTFLANMSHEIRTPMNGVLAMSNLLASTSLTKEQSDIVSTLIASSNGMMRLINDLLLFSKIESGKFDVVMEWIPLCTIVSDLTSTFSTMASNKGIQFGLHVDPMVPSRIYADNDRIRQCLTNILDNAIKFTQAGTVSLSITMGKYFHSLIEPTESKEGDCVKFSIHDTGIGILPEVMNSIFEPFSQGDMSTTRKYGGTGLGLSISKELIKCMGGDIHVESQVGVGSSFSFDIPIPFSSPDNAPPNPPNPNDETGSFILPSATAALSNINLPYISVQPCSHSLSEIKHHSPPPQYQHSESSSSSSSSSSTFNKLTEIPPSSTFMTPSATATTTHLNLLVAEDNRINQKVIRRLLERDGHVITMTNNGLDAFRGFEENPFNYDCILMDWHMPTLDGLECTKLIRRTEMKAQQMEEDKKYMLDPSVLKQSFECNNEIYDVDFTHFFTPTSHYTSSSSSSCSHIRRISESRFHIPIIITTASTFADDIQKCFIAGIDEFISKPIEAPVLRTKLSNLITNYGQITQTQANIR